MENSVGAVPVVSFLVTRLPSGPMYVFVCVEVDMPPRPPPKDEEEDEKEVNELLIPPPPDPCIPCPKG